MKQLKDILVERLVLSKNKSRLTLGVFVRWYASPRGKPPLDTDDIDRSSIKGALEDNDKDITSSIQLVRFYNEHKDDSLLDLKEEIIENPSYPTVYRVSFMVDDVYFTINLTESFEEYLKTI